MDILRIIPYILLRKVEKFFLKLISNNHIEKNMHTKVIITFYLFAVQISALFLLKWNITEAKQN